MIFFPLFMKNKMYNEQTHKGIVLMVEQRSPKPTVVSSSLTAPAILHNNHIFHRKTKTVKEYLCVLGLFYLLVIPL